MPNSPGRPRDAYLVLDASGSTITSGLNDACNEAMPYVVDALTNGVGPTDRLAVLVAGPRAATLLDLTRPVEVAMIPVVAAGGIAALAPALDLITTSMLAERVRAADDGESRGDGVRAAVVIVCDGDPVDDPVSLAAAIERLRSGGPSVGLAVAVTGAIVRTDLASLADSVVDLTASVGDPARLGDAVAAVLRR